MKQIRQKLPIENWDKYRGSIVLEVDDIVYTTKQPNKVTKLIKEIEKKHHKTPVISVIPKEDLLIV